MLRKYMACLSKQARLGLTSQNGTTLCDRMLCIIMLFTVTLSLLYRPNLAANKEICTITHLFNPDGYYATNFVLTSSAYFQLAHH